MSDDVADDEPAVYLVIIEPGGLFGAYLDQKRADRQAKAVEGVLVKVPVLHDYRKGAKRER